jgi:predicted aspartyl protease
MAELKYEQIFENNPKGLFIKLKARKPGETREVTYKTLFDTGAEVSGVTQKVVDDLGLEKVKEVSMVDANGNNFMRPTYKVDFIIPTKPDTYDFCDIEVPLATSTQREDILLGMNVLSQCSFSLVKGGHDYKLVLEIDIDKIS